jgi:hypothetical protein
MHPANQPYSHPSPQMTAQSKAQSMQPYAGVGARTPSPGAGAQGQMQQQYYPQDSYYSQHGATEYGYLPVRADMANLPAGGIGSWFNFSDTVYLKGFAIGAGVTLLLTNSAVQKALVRGSVKLWSLVQGGVEEVKEQFRDVKAELSQEE